MIILIQASHIIIAYFHENIWVFIILLIKSFMINNLFIIIRENKNFFVNNILFEIICYNRIITNLRILIIMNYEYNQFILDNVMKIFLLYNNNRINYWELRLSFLYHLFQICINIFNFSNISNFFLSNNFCNYNDIIWDFCNKKKSQWWWIWIWSNIEEYINYEE